MMRVLLCATSHLAVHNKKKQRKNVNWFRASLKILSIQPWDHFTLVNYRTFFDRESHNSIKDKGSVRTNSSFILVFAISNLRFSNGNRGLTKAEADQKEIAG